jgi:5-formyltetrahydrofolate cyclo-ligase
MQIDCPIAAQGKIPTNSIACIPSLMSKVELRRSLLKKRKSLSQQEWQEKSDRLVSHLLASPLFTPGKTILAYFSCRQEPDLNSLFHRNSHNWGLPRCVGENLAWHIWQPGEEIQVGAYGIFEPLPIAPTISPAAVDLILVPAVACDYRGYRLGYGGGYYDRLLSSPLWRSKPTIGIVFEFAYLPQLPIDRWDIPLHGVCTEERLEVRG